MGLIGIDKNFQQDGIIGAVIGGIFVFLNQLSELVALGFPSLPLALSSAEKFIILVLALPVGEEGLFRGLLLSFLRDSLRLGTGTAIFLQALCFSVFHYAFYGSIVSGMGAFVGAFLLGYVNGWLAVKYNSLLPPTIVHIIFNAYLIFVRYQFLVVGGM